MPAEMDDVEAGQELRQIFPQRVVEGCRSLTAAHAEQDGLAALKPKEGQRPPPIPAVELLTDGRAGADGFVALDMGEGVLKGDEDLAGKGDRQLVGQAGGVVALVEDDGDVAAFARRTDRHRYEARPWRIRERGGWP